jgi:spore coat protein CotH
MCGNGMIDTGEVCDDGTNDLLNGGCLPGCLQVDQSDQLFSKQLLDIRLTIDPATWELLRHEEKPRHELFGGLDCTSRPATGYYTWHQGDISIDGVSVGAIGMRKKGFIGSQAERSPGIKIDFNKFTNGQSYLGLDGFALNNNKQDRTFFKQCAAYDIFRAAGIPSPRCTLARVYVNQQEQGIYTLLEEVDKGFLKRHFSNANGNMYEGTLVDFRTDAIDGFDQESNAPNDRQDLAAVVQAIELPDDQLLAGLEPLINLDKFFRFWATEVLIWHRDGYSGNSNNFFIYADPSDNGRFSFLPWGVDGVMLKNTNAGNPEHVLAFGKLANRLYAIPTQRARFNQTLNEVVQTIWQPAQLLARLDQSQAMLTPLLNAVDLQTMTDLGTALRTFITERADRIATAQAINADWTLGLRKPPCRIPSGTVTVSVQTTWDTLPNTSFGTGTMTMSLDNQPLILTRSGVRAGIPRNGQGQITGQPRISLVADTATRRYSLTAIYPDERWFDQFDINGSHALVSPPLSINLTEQDTTVTPSVTLRSMELGGGTWTFSSVTRTPGETVAASFTSPLWILP